MGARKPKVEAWGWAVEGSDSPGEGPWITWEGEHAAHDKMVELQHQDHYDDEPVRKMRVVKLVPHDPAATAVVRAVLAWAKGTPQRFRDTAPLAIVDVVSRLEKKRGGR